MKKLAALAIVLGTVATAHATTINPQAGDSVWTIASRLGQAFDNTTGSEITNADAVGGVITISVAGNYFVAENLTNRIVIDADNVCLNLNCKKVSSADGSANVITVNSNRNYITVCNGMVINTDSPTGTGAGILVNAGASCVYIERVKVVGCGNGVKLAGADGSEVIECELIALDLVANTTGVQLVRADENTIQNCRLLHNTQAGVELLHSEENCVQNCQALKTEGSATVAAYTSDSGQSNLFEHCIAKKTITSAWEFCNKAYGFLLTGTEEKTKIIDCIVNETDMTSTVSAVAYGIHLKPVLLEDDDLLNFIDDDNTPGNSVHSVAWSPNGKYIASGDARSISGDTGDIRVFGFDGAQLTHIDSSLTPGTTVLAVSWSPCGNYVASGDQNNNVRVFRFDGSQLSHVDADSTSGNPVDAVAWSPCGKYIAVGDQSSNVRVFLFDGSQLTHIANIGTSARVASVAWSPDGKYIVGGDSGSAIRVFSFNGGQLAPADVDTSPGGTVEGVAWSPCGKYIASGDTGNYIRIFGFDGSQLDLITTSTFDLGGYVFSVAWSPDSKYIASGDWGNNVRIFNFDGSQLANLKNSSVTYWVDSVSWSPDGKYIASGDRANFISIFDAMNSPQNCLVKNCTVDDTAACGLFFGTGIAGGGQNAFLNNACCFNDVNFSYGVPNVYYGSHNSDEPFMNISMPTLP